MAKPTATPDSYIAGFPPVVRKQLEKVRLTIRKAAPDAEEAMAYGVPAFTQNGVLVCYAAFKNHIGYYPMPSGIKAFSKQLEAYDCAAGTVRFPLDKPLPVKLIADIAAFRAEEQQKKSRK